MGKFTKENLGIRRMTPDDIQKELDAFEARYQMSSGDFYRRYNTGDLPEESRDYVLWAGYYDMAARVGIVHGQVKV